jgi:hypothetical protein
LEGEGLDLESIAVTDAADFEEAEVEPAGGGDRRGITRGEQDQAKGQRRHKDAGEEDNH